MKVNVKKSQRILDDFFKVERAVLQYEKFDGTISEDIIRLNFDRGDSVAALLVNPVEKKIILVKQFRYPIFTKDPKNAWALEIVAGLVEKGATAEETMKKEILEEIGYRVDQLKLLFFFYPSPGGSNEKVFLYYSEINQRNKSERGGGIGVEGEDIQIVEISFDEAFNLLNSGKIYDSKTIIALQWLKQNFK